MAITLKAADREEHLSSSDTYQDLYTKIDSRFDYAAFHDDSSNGMVRGHRPDLHDNAVYVCTDSPGEALRSYAAVE